MQIPDINLDTMTDLAMRQIVIQLLNLIEALAAENAALRVENQQLRDEVARLKGGSGKPDLKPSVKSSPHDHSSEAERQVRTPRGKPKKNATLTVTHEERCAVDPAELPSDAVRHGTRDTIVQRLRSAFSAPPRKRSFHCSISATVRPCLRAASAAVVSPRRISSTRATRRLAVQRLRVSSLLTCSLLISSTSSSDYCSVGHLGGLTVQGGSIA